MIEKALKHLFPNAVNGVDYEIHDKSDGNGEFIAVWNLQDPKPNDGQLTAAASAADAAAVTEKNNRKSRKQAVLAKLGLIAGDIQALNELIEDGDDQ